MASVLSPNTSALVGGGCSRSLEGLRTGGESGGGWPSASVWRMKRLCVETKGGRQQHMVSNATTLVLQETSSGNSISPMQENCDGHLSSSAKVFEDEAEGICCYRSTSGEVTCEGNDEGPYFQPARCERAAQARSFCCESSSMDEVFTYKYIKAGQGKAWCEGKDES